MKVHSCNYCNYQSDILYNLNVHQRHKYGNQSEMSVGHNGMRAPTSVSIPPNVHPYLNHGYQPIPQNWFMAQHPHGYEYGEEVRAPTKVRVGPNGPRAPTTVSVPPQIGGLQQGSGIGDQFHIHSQNSFDGARQDANNRAPTTYHR